MRKLILLTVVIAAGCSKSSNQAAQQQEKSATTPSQPQGGTDSRKLIVAFGDSLTSGYNVEPGRSYPDFLQKQLDAKKQAFRVVNAGVAGETSTDALNRVSMVLADKPAIVIVEFGGNDGLRGLPVATTRANLEKILGIVQKSGAQVVLAGMRLPPNYGPEYIKPFEKMYPELAPKYNATLIPFILVGTAGNPELMQQDGIHPNEEGNRIVADTVFQTLQHVIPKL